MIGGKHQQLRRRFGPVAGRPDARQLARQIADAAERMGDLRPNVGYGVGVRWRSPVGMLRLDLARGTETGQFRVHFSVGISL